MIIKKTNDQIETKPRISISNNKCNHEKGLREQKRELVPL